ncbi:DegT/DnrJ/EryC1/StrS family aminotransferase [Roseospirillum parvum]|uniref:dTDP-4-amino-4,6-dideoxygalactose transaminase n=1 Tax=Roseospirillum parvum TaxID=83401 RepID=A0A1G7WX71_9PROT|nr:DegT/DnrJ/EryC1/StrS family aminotransferase [Roseospirillum parvum]SDG76531.1 dTDP-4-amino-4,6-dideoxygalactose transaminase [Roseospirillum parvum]
MSPPANLLAEYARHTLDDSDRAAVAEALLDERLTTGPRVGAFEAAFATRVGAAHAVACNSGTAALEMIYAALEVPGRPVVVPAITFLATASAALRLGGRLAVADVDPARGHLTPDTLAATLAALPQPAAAVTVVHLGGPPADLPALAEVARRHGTVLVEDACHALGSVETPDGAPVGACTFSRAAAFSFHPAKTITTGEGGMVTSPDPALAEAARRHRNHGMVRAPAPLRADSLATAPWYYEMHSLAGNFRLTDFQAALGLSQLTKLDTFVEKRRRLRDHYLQRLAPLSPRVKPLEPLFEGTIGWHLMGVRVEDFAAGPEARAATMTALKARGIGSQVHYIPLYRQPHLADTLGPAADPARFPGAEAYYARCLSLPLFPDLEEADVDTVCAALEAALG